MSNPWREVFDEVRFDNGNTYDYCQNVNEEDGYAVDFRKVREAVYAIRQKAKRENIRVVVAMNQYFGTAKLGPAERAAVRAKLLGAQESFQVDDEIQEDSQAIARGYTAADRSMAQSLGRAQQEQQRRDAARNAQKQTQQKLTTGGSIAQYQSNSYQPEGDELQEKITASTSVKTIIDDFIKSKDRRLAGRTKKERIKAALAASYQAKRKANEEVENFVEEKYGEKYEKKYGPSTGKNTVGNLDGDDQPNEPDSHEYAGVKDRAIKNAIKKRMKSESSDWRADLGFFTEKRYLESPHAETMPSEPSMSFTQGSKEKAANKRMKPKSSQMEEDFTPLAEALGGYLIESAGTAMRELGTEISSVVKALRRSGEAKNVIVPFKRAPKIEPPKVKIKPQALVAPEIPQPVRVPKPKPQTEPVPSKPKTEPQPQEQPLTSPPKTKPNPKTAPTEIDVETGILKKVKPSGSKVKFTQAGKSQKPEVQTQAQSQKMNKTKIPTTSTVDTSTGQSSEDPGKGRFKMPKIGTPSYGAGNIWVARTL